MKIIKLHLHPFAGTVNKTYQFESGLNVVYGNNEAGKSTIVKSLLLVLLIPTNLSKLDFKSQVSSFIPIGGDTIHIDLLFEVEGIMYELKKSWGVQNVSSLNKLGQVGINDANEVQAALYKLLKLNKSTVRDVLFTTQVKIANTIDAIMKEKDAEVINSLDQILRSAILNTGDINPEQVKSQLANEFERLTSNWLLDEEMPVISKNNKGSFENKWSREVGEILELSYEIYDKELALENRINYDLNYTKNANAINDLKQIVNVDKSFIDNNAVLVESLTLRKEMSLEIDTQLTVKENLRTVQAEWNAINANLPVNKNNYKLYNDQLIKLREEIENARLASDAVVKIAQFENIVSLKNKVQKVQDLLQSMQAVTDKEVAAVKLIYDPLQKSKAELSSLEAAQKFIVNIHPKTNLEVDLQHSSNISALTKLTTGNNISIEVNKGFRYNSAEVTIEVKSMTDQISQLETKIEELSIQYQSALKKMYVNDFQTLLDLNDKYNNTIQLLNSVKSNYESAIAGNDFDELNIVVNKIKNLPKTRSVEDLDSLINSLIESIAALKLLIDNDIKKLEGFVATHGTLDKLDELRLICIQNEQTAKEKLASLPPIDASFDIVAFRSKYLEAKNRLKENDAELKNLELERAKLEGGQPEILASELQDQIELLQRQKAQKIEEAKAIEKVLNKLNDILARNASNPYQSYEQNLSKYLNTLSGGKYEIMASNKLTPDLIRNTASNFSLPIELLSQGTSGVLGLSLRFAMADYYLAGLDGFLVFDDPMVDFDENRQQLAAKCFKEYAKNKQVFIFTCHQSHANLLSENLINV
jgi:DNA repair exonuclease SbcCD ATPase subunit